MLALKNKLHIMQINQLSCCHFSCLLLMLWLIFLANHLAKWFSERFSRCISDLYVFMKGGLKDETRSHALSVKCRFSDSGRAMLLYCVYCRLKVNNNKSSLISPPSVFSLWYYRGHSPGIFLKAEPRVLTFLLHTLEELTCQFDIQKGAKFKCQEFSLAA